MRLLAPARLSRMTDETTSIDTQVGQCERYAAAHGHEIVATSSDLNVSGAVPIRERPGIGPWLRPERLADWDGIIGYKLDRLFRSQADYVDFYRDFCQVHGKVIISAGEGLDTSTEVGEFAAGLMVKLAELERGRMRARRRDAAARLRQAARWNGGRVPYGYRPNRLAGGGWELVPDDVTGAVVRDLAAKVIAGQSCSSLVVELNRAGTPAAAGGKWAAGSVAILLRSDVLRGYVQHWPPREKGAPVPPPRLVRGSDGLPLRRLAVLDDETWHRLQAALDANARPESGIRSNASPLLRVASCALCGRPLYRTTRERRGRTEADYRCRDSTEAHAGGEPCTARQIPGAPLDDAAAWLFLDAAGRDTEIMERVPVAGEDHTAELASVAEAIRDLQSDRYQRGLFRGQRGAEDYARIMTDLEAERDRLAELPVRPAGHQLRPTGETFGARWEREDTDGRRRLMLDSGFRLQARVLDSGYLEVTALADTELAGRAAAAAGGQHPEPVTGEESDLGASVRVVLLGPVCRRAPERS